MAEKPRSKGRDAAVMGGGLGSGIVIAWGWNMIFPDAQMPSEVASAIGGGVVLLAGWIDRKVSQFADQ